MGLTKAVAAIPREAERYQALVATLVPWISLFRGKDVLDYGSSWGTSTLALLEQGAANVTGVDIAHERIVDGVKSLRGHFMESRVHLTHVPDTRQLPFTTGRFPFVLANAVLEHIPQPRTEHLAELWRVVAPGGYLMINETPNTLYPKDVHTTRLWFNQWLPRDAALRRAVRRGRYDPTRQKPWEQSGWRGCHYWELKRPLHGARLVPETTRRRHRLFSAMGLPASLLDPFPTWVWQKP